MPTMTGVAFWPKPSTAMASRTSFLCPTLPRKRGRQPEVDDSIPIQLAG